MKELMRAAQSSALSGSEPNTLEYKITRLLETDGTPTSTFVFIEKYLNHGFEENLRSEGTAVLLKAWEEEKILAAPPELQFCDEL